MSPNLIMRLRLISFALGYTFLFFLVACRPVEPRDLLLENVEIVKLSDAPGVWAWGQQLDNKDQEKILLIKVIFSSAVNLVEFSESKALQISHEVSTCTSERNDFGNEVVAVPYVRAGGNVVGSDGDFAKRDLEFLRKTGRYLYEIYIPINGSHLTRLYGKGPTFSGKYIPLYDITAAQSDLCLRLKGAQMWFGASFRSNTIRISHSSIVAIKK